MSKCRPATWSNPYIGKANTPYAMALQRDAYEEGADAMLLLLSLEGSIRTHSTASTVLIELPNIQDGTWVFVPDTTGTIIATVRGDTPALPLATPKNMYM